MSKIKETVIALGRQNICEKLSVSSQSITNAIADGYFPATWYTTLRDLGDENDVPIPESLFNFKKSPHQSEEQLGV